MATRQSLSEAVIFSATVLTIVVSLGGLVWIALGLLSGRLWTTAYRFVTVAGILLALQFAGGGLAGLLSATSKDS